MARRTATVKDLVAVATPVSEVVNVDEITAMVPQMVNIGKIPGIIKEISVKEGVKVREVFRNIGISDLERCEIQRNGQVADLDDIVEAGDTILAIAKIRGN